MPNSFAFVMLFLWPFLAVVAFRPLPLPSGIAAAVIGGYLLLPVKTEVDLPLLPTFDKHLSASIAALLLIAMAPTDRRAAVAGTGARRGAGEVLKGWIPGSTWARLCLGAMILGTLVTAMLNTDPVAYGPRVIPGLTLYDSLSAVLDNLMLILPFLIARRYFAAPDNQRQLMVVLVVAGTLYAFLALFEIRMSPQLNVWTYGFFPHTWIMHVRGDGFRPLVFLAHGLRLSLFLTVAFLGAVACARYLPRHNLRPAFVAVAALLFVTVFLTKSLGAFIIAVVFAPVAIFATLRPQLLFAAAVTAAVLTYPVLRGNDLVPVYRILSFAEQIDANRAASFHTRLYNEDILLEKANRKAVFGWGGWGRSRIYDEEGRDIGVTDGTWVILFGQGGWVLYLSVFGLLCLPVLLTAARQRRLKPDGVTVGLTLMLAANLIDLIPNSGLVPVTWLLAGSLAGRLEWQGRAVPEAEGAAAGPPERAATFAPARDSGAVQPPVDTPPGPAPEPAATPKPRSPYAPVLPGASGTRP